MISDIDKYLQGPKMYFFWFGFSTPVDLGGGVRVKHLIWNLISTTSRPTFLKSWDSSMFCSFESKTIFLFLFDILVCFTVHGFLFHIFFFCFMMHNVWHETIVGVPVYHLHCFSTKPHCCNTCKMWHCFVEVGKTFPEKYVKRIAACLTFTFNLYKYTLVFLKILA